MNRKLNANLVVLPQLDVNGACAVSAALIARSKEDADLTEAVIACVKRLEESVATLNRVSAGPIEASSVDEEVAKQAKLAFHAAWSAAHALVGGWSKMPERKGGERSRSARVLEAGLFAGGMKFLRLTEKKRWAESDRRLRWLAEQQLEGTFERLGGAVFLEELKEAHQKFGEVVAITKSPPPLPGGPSIRDALSAVRMRIRELVVQVTAFGGTEAPRAQERATKMLAPLAEWVSPRPKPSAPEPQPAPAPAVPPPVTPPHV
jgi:hypothetical protein